MATKEAADSGTLNQGWNLRENGDCQSERNSEFRKFHESSIMATDTSSRKCAVQMISPRSFTENGGGVLANTNCVELR